MGVGWGGVGWDGTAEMRWVGWDREDAVQPTGREDAWRRVGWGWVGLGGMGWVGLGWNRMGGIGWGGMGGIGVG